MRRMDYGTKSTIFCNRFNWICIFDCIVMVFLDMPHSPFFQRSRGQMMETIKRYFIEIFLVVSIGIVLGFLVAAYELERAKVTVLCRVKLEKDACEEILK